MKKLGYKTLAISLSFALGAFSAAQAAEEKVVAVYNWANYLEPTFIENFTKETGIKVIYDTFDTNEFLLTKVLSGKTGYDVIGPGVSFIGKMIEADALMPLDRSKLPNSANSWPVIDERIKKFPKAFDYSVNYVWGTTGIAYNADKLKERLPADFKPDSLRLLFDPEIVSKLQNCGVYLLDTADEVVPAALVYAGLDPNSTKTEDLAKAEEVLMKVRPFIRKFYSSEQQNTMASGDGCVSMAWSGDMLTAKKRAEEAKNGVKLEYIVPKEGGLMWLDQLAIPKDAPHPENAQIFINYVMDAQNNAKIQNYLNFATRALP